MTSESERNNQPPQRHGIPRLRAYTLEECIQLGLLPDVENNAEYNTSNNTDEEEPTNG